MCKILAILLLLTAPLGAFARPLSVCQIAAAPSQYAGKVITLAATYRTDLRHFSGLTDRRCPAVVIAPYDVEGRKHPSVIRFDQAVAGELEDHSARIFSVVVVGTFEQDPPAKFGRFTILRVQRFARSPPRLRPNNSFKPKR